MTGRETMSSFKLGISILWPACWTGFRLKWCLRSLIMTMGSMHFEDTIRCDIFNAVAESRHGLRRFVISPRLGFAVRRGNRASALFGMSIPSISGPWPRGAHVLFGAAADKSRRPRLGSVLGEILVEDGAYWNFLSSASLVDCKSRDGDCHHRIALDGRMASTRHFFGTGLPIAERIGLELTIWGSISSAVLIVLGGYRDFQTWTDRSPHGGKLPSGV